MRPNNVVARPTEKAKSNVFPITRPTPKDVMIRKNWKGTKASALSKSTLRKISQTGKKMKTPTMKTTKMTAPAMKVSPRWKPSSEMPMANSAARHIITTPVPSPMEVLVAIKLSSMDAMASPAPIVKTHPTPFFENRIHARGTMRASNPGNIKVALR